MLPANIEERSLVARVIERAEERHGGGGVEFGGDCGWRVQEHVVLECNCRARFVLYGAAIWQAGLDVLECGVCGERFLLTR